MDNITNKIIISDLMATRGAKCPFCGRYFKPNGTGPESSPKLTKWLKKLPSDHILRYGSLFHDWAYHIGGKRFTRLQADKLMLDKNIEKINQECKWWNKWFFLTMNRRNYYMVRMFGEPSYNKEGCSHEHISS